MKNTLLFLCSTNILLRLLTVNMKNCLTPKNPKMGDPILETLFKMRPHYSQSSSETATPSSSTSPLTSYREVPPPPFPSLMMLYHLFLRTLKAFPFFTFSSRTAQIQVQENYQIFIENQTVHCESIAGKVSYEWSHFRVSSTDSKVRTAL